MSRLALILVAKECLHAAERTEAPQTRRVTSQAGGLVDARRSELCPSNGPGFGIGGVILVAINIERRRNSGFVIYC